MDSSDHNNNSNQLNGIESIRQYIDRLITGDGQCHISTCFTRQTL